MGFLFHKKPPLLGIDIGACAVKLLELSRRDRKPYCVESYAVEPLPTGAIAGNRIMDAPLVSMALKRALRRSRTTAHHAAIAVAGSTTMTKTIRLPKGLSERELESLIELEAGQHIPFPLDEVNIDFVVLGPSPDEADKVDVLLAAARTDHVNERVAALEMAGLQAQVVDLENLVIERACEYLLPSSIRQHVALLDIGAYTTRLYVLRNGQLTYRRDQGFGGQQLTQQIQHHYGLPYDKAELAKRQGDYPLHLLKPFVHKMTQQINRAIQSYGSYHQLQGLILVGGGILLSGAIQAIRQQISTPVTLMNPFQRMSIRNPAERIRFQHHSPAMFLAYGLALRGVD